MSARSDLVEVSCDGPFPGLDEVGCEGSAAMTHVGTAADVRKALREEGWKTGLPGGFDRCPACQQTQAEFKAWRAQQEAAATTAPNSRAVDAHG